MLHQRKDRESHQQDGQQFVHIDPLSSNQLLHDVSDRGENQGRNIKSHTHTEKQLTEPQGQRSEVKDNTPRDLLRIVLRLRIRFRDGAAVQAAAVSLKVVHDLNLWRSRDAGSQSGNAGVW